jgi:hypothetical protein
MLLQARSDPISVDPTLCLTSALPDIKALTISSPNLLKELDAAFERYNEEQFATVKLPGGSQPVIVSTHSSLGDGRYYDVESSSSFAFDHATQVSEIRGGSGAAWLTKVLQKASAVQSYVLEGPQTDLV